jgi:hypothetical protein
MLSAVLRDISKLGVMKPELAALQACKYLYLHTITELGRGGLCLVIHEAIVGGPQDATTMADEPLPELRAMLAQSNAIIHGQGCKVFEIAWPSYIAYAVENESFALPEPNESIGTGRLFVEYTKSVYLEYLEKATFASVEYPGPFKHWAVLCLDHIVNVASTEDPSISVSTNDA